MPALRRIACYALLALGLGGAHWAQAQSPASTAAPTALAGADGREGTFKAVQGQVTVVRGNVHSAAVVSGPVYASDRLVTGPGSAASLILRDGSVISVGPDSVMNLSSFAFNATTQEGNLLVDLLRGSLRMATGLIAKLKPEQVKVTTPTTVVGVRGTDFIVEENP